MDDKRRFFKMCADLVLVCTVFAAFSGNSKENINSQNKTTNNRELYTKITNMLFFSCSVIVAATVIFFVGFIFYVAWPTFQNYGIISFITSDAWDYSTNEYGIKAFIAGTLIMTTVTMILAVPISIFTAIFLSEIASARTASFIRPFIELLVGIPSVVYGIFGLLVLESIFAYQIEPWFASHLGFLPWFVDVNPQIGNGILLASTVLAIMVFPTITTISENAIRSVSVEYRLASYSLGANKWETIRNVTLPTASSGIMTAIVLGMMRATGETMAIVMLLGNVKVIPSSLLSPAYAMTSKILNDIGYHFAEENARSALFAIAAVLFTIEIGFVAIARYLGGRK